MQRLRHPIRSIREPFGKAGLTVAILALVMALVGGAYAAGGLTKSQEKQVKKIAKKYAGKPGAPGTNGTNGSNGAAGAKGEKGDTGAKGEKGDPGNTGPAGKSVVTTALAPGGTCAEGGTEFEVQGQGSPEVVCNGEEGTQGIQGPRGPEGALGTAGTTLPTNATETGVWVADPNGIAYMEAPISFTIPLASPLGDPKVHFLTEQEVGYAEEGKFGGGSFELCEGKTGTPLTTCEAEKRTLLKTTCAGNSETPKAASGNLCVYSSGTVSEASFAGITNLQLEEGASVAGALVVFLPTTNPAKGFATGSWAVTG